MTDEELELFPTSESALKMLSYVTEGWYDRSYVGKWLYQVMGLEYDTAYTLAEELPLQFFPETATWGLCWHEIKWGLPVRENLSYDDRRRLIYQKRDTRYPIIPAIMEKYLTDAFGIPVYVSDIHDAGPYGYVPEHPNVFKVFFVGEETLDTKKAFSMIDRLKQSHTAYKVQDRFETSIDNRGVESCRLTNVNFHVSVMYWHSRIYNGSLCYDGTFLYNAKRRYGLVLGLKYYQGKICNQEEIRQRFARFRMRTITQNHIATGIKQRLELDSSDEIQGKMRMELETGIVEPLEKISDVTVITRRDVCFYDGAARYNGSRIYNAIFKKETVE